MRSAGVNHRGQRLEIKARILDVLHERKLVFDKVDLGAQMGLGGAIAGKEGGKPHAQFLGRLPGGTLGGVLILAVLDTVFNIMRVDPFFKDVLRGVIIIAAVAIYARRQIDRRARRIRFDDGGGGRPVNGAGPAPDAPVPAHHAPSDGGGDR